MAADYQEGLQEKGPMQCVHRWPFKFVTVIYAWSKPADSGHIWLEVIYLQLHGCDSELCISIMTVCNHPGLVENIRHKESVAQNLS